MTGTILHLTIIPRASHRALSAVMAAPPPRWWRSRKRAFGLKIRHLGTQKFNNKTNIFLLNSPSMTSWTVFSGAENVPKSNSTFEFDRCWVWSSLIRLEGEEYSWPSEINAIFNSYDEVHGRGSRWRFFTCVESRTDRMVRSIEVLNPCALC